MAASSSSISLSSSSSNYPSNQDSLDAPVSATLVTLLEKLANNTRTGDDALIKKFRAQIQIGVGFQINMKVACQTYLGNAGMGNNLEKIAQKINRYLNTYKRDDYKNNPILELLYFIQYLENIFDDPNSVVQKISLFGENFVERTPIIETINDDSTLFAYIREALTLSLDEIIHNNNRILPGDPDLSINFLKIFVALLALKNMYLGTPYQKKCISFIYQITYSILPRWFTQDIGDAYKTSTAQLGFTHLSSDIQRSVDIMLAFIHMRINISTLDIKTIVLSTIDAWNDTKPFKGGYNVLSKIAPKQKLEFMQTLCHQLKVGDDKQRDILVRGVLWGALFNVELSRTSGLLMSRLLYTFGPPPMSQRLEMATSKILSEEDKNQHWFAYLLPWTESGTSSSSSSTVVDVAELHLALDTSTFTNNFSDLVKMFQLHWQKIINILTDRDFVKTHLPQAAITPIGQLLLACINKNFNKVEQLRQCIHFIQRLSTTLIDTKNFEMFYALMQDGVFKYSDVLNMIQYSSLNTSGIDMVKLFSILLYDVDEKNKVVFQDDFNQIAKDLWSLDASLAPYRLALLAPYQHMQSDPRTQTASSEQYFKDYQSSQTNERYFVGYVELQKSTMPVVVGDKFKSIIKSRLRYSISARNALVLWFNAQSGESLKALEQDLVLHIASVVMSACVQECPTDICVKKDLMVNILNQVGLDQVINIIFDMAASHTFGNALKLSLDYQGKTRSVLDIIHHNIENSDERANDYKQRITDRINKQGNVDELAPFLSLMSNTPSGWFIEEIIGKYIDYLILSALFFDARRDVSKSGALKAWHWIMAFVDDVTWMKALDKVREKVISEANATSVSMFLQATRLHYPTFSYDMMFLDILHRRDKKNEPDMHEQLLSYMDLNLLMGTADKKYHLFINVLKEKQAKNYFELMFKRFRQLVGDTALTVEPRPDTVTRFVNYFNEENNLLHVLIVNHGHQLTTQWQEVALWLRDLIRPVLRARSDEFRNDILSMGVSQALSKLSDSLKNTTHGLEIFSECFAEHVLYAEPSLGGKTPHPTKNINDLYYSGDDWCSAGFFELLNNPSGPTAVAGISMKKLIQFSDEARGIRTSVDRIYCMNLPVNPLRRSSKVYTRGRFLPLAEALSREIDLRRQPLSQWIMMAQEEPYANVLKQLNPAIIAEVINANPSVVSQEARQVLSLALGHNDALSSALSVSTPELENPVVIRPCNDMITRWKTRFEQLVGEALGASSVPLSPVSAAPSLSLSSSSTSANHPIISSSVSKYEFAASSADSSSFGGRPPISSDMPTPSATSVASSFATGASSSASSPLRASSPNHFFGHEEKNKQNGTEGSHTNTTNPADIASSLNGSGSENVSSSSPASSSSALYPINAYRKLETGLRPEDEKEIYGSST